MARGVIDNDHFTAILGSADPKLRRAVYDLLKPLLRFKPKAYSLLKFNARRAS